MNRADPLALRAASIAARALVQAGVMFVCVPVVSQDDFLALTKMADARLEAMAQAIENEETKS
jgi:hypothetical protein